MRVSVAAGATRVTTPMFLAAAAALAETPGLGSAPGASLLPPLERAREVSSSIAVAVATAAVEDGVAPAATRSEIERAVGEKTWTPEYRPYVRAGT